MTLTGLIHIKGFKSLESSKPVYSITNFSYKEFLKKLQTVDYKMAKRLHKNTTYFPKDDLNNLKLALLKLWKAEQNIEISHFSLLYKNDTYTTNFKAFTLLFFLLYLEGVTDLLIYRKEE